MTFISEFISFIIQRKKYWLIPIMIAVAVFGGLVILSQGSVVAPFVYTLF